MLLEIFVIELLAIDGPTACALFDVASVSAAPKRLSGSGKSRVAATFPRARRLHTYIAMSKVASLNHEPGDDAVEFGACVTITLLTCAQCAEVLRRLGREMVVKVEDYTARLLCWHGLS